MIQLISVYPPSWQLNYTWSLTLIYIYWVPCSGQKQAELTVPYFCHLQRRPDDKLLFVQWHASCMIQSDVTRGLVASDAMPTINHGHVYCMTMEVCLFIGLCSVPTWYKWLNILTQLMITQGPWTVKTGRDFLSLGTASDHDHDVSSISSLRHVRVYLYTYTHSWLIIRQAIVWEYFLYQHWSWRQSSMRYWQWLLAS